MASHLFTIYCFSFFFWLRVLAR